MKFYILLKSYFIPIFPLPTWVFQDSEFDDYFILCHNLTKNLIDKKQKKSSLIPFNTIHLTNISHPPFISLTL